MVLPSLLLTLDKHAVTKAFESEPIIEIYNEADLEDEKRSDSVQNNDKPSS